MKVSSSNVTTKTPNVDSEIHHASMLFLPCASNSPKDGVPGAFAMREQLKKHSGNFALGSHDSDKATGVFVNCGSKHQHAAEAFASRKILGEGSKAHTV